MHRLANPGSNIGKLKNGFLFLYKYIEKDEYFGLHDMQEILVTAGKISSSGTVGSEALKKGSNKNLTLDKSYNQCKMYAEVYRVLGWLQSREDRALEYNFTLLGDYIYESQGKRSLIEQCFIGIEFPNDVIDSTQTYKQRIMPLILHSMQNLNGVISLKELIYLRFIEDDTDEILTSKTREKILHFRKHPEEMDESLDKLYEKRRITENTAKNYTRLTNGGLIGMNWAERSRDRTNYKKSTHVFKITQHGLDISNKLREKKDLRLNEVKSKNIEQIVSISSFYGMLQASGIDISGRVRLKKECDELLEQAIGTKNIIFSPFQTFNSKTLSEIFEKQLPQRKRVSSRSIEPTANKKKYSGINIPLYDTPETQSINELSQKIQELLIDHTEKEVLKELKRDFVKYGQKDFYPLIQEIFECLGIACALPSSGINYQRWDALLWSESDAIPIEIKSPGEEKKLGIKAIRQALENKVILHSRHEQNIPIKRDTVSLVIGWEVPNQRGEAFELIEDIHNTYKVKIAALGINHLLNVCIKAVKDNKKAEFKDFTSLFGVCK